MPSTGRARPAVASLPAYRPGRSALQANLDHGLTDSIKLASNECPYGPVEAVVEAITSAARSANRYCDHRAAALREAIAGWVGVEEDRVTVGAGSVALMYQLATGYLDPGDEVVTPWISFEAYPIMTRLMAGTLVKAPLVDHAFDLDGLADSITERTKLVALATPNNPTGTAVSTGEIAGLLARIPEDVVVLVDEAYREFTDPALGDPITELLGDHSNVIVTRTFSKAYALAGLRVGYAIADPEIIATVDKCLAPFNVNGLGQAAALAALGALDEFQARVTGLVAERNRVAATLRESGWELPESQANFVFLPTGARTDDIYMGLERRGVVVRPFSGVGMRVTIGTPADNDRFLATLAEVTDRAE